jgi:hypothetical protein
VIRAWRVGRLNHNLEIAIAFIRPRDFHLENLIAASSAASFCHEEFSERDRVEPFEDSGESILPVVARRREFLHLKVL